MEPLQQHTRPFFLNEKGGFSLVELLVVMALLSVLTAASLPSFRGTLDGISVSGAAGIAEAEIAHARQTAMSRNVPVEVRFYKHNDGTGNGWRLMALVIPAAASGQAADEWLGSGKTLPSGIIMEDSQSFSTILSKASVPDSTANKTSPLIGKESSGAPRILRDKDYVAFQFRPDGSTDLPSDQPWCLTLRNSKSQLAADRPVGNFVSLVIDSATGRTLSYQP